jgi:hypothetical protein
LKCFYKGGIVHYLWLLYFTQLSEGRTKQQTADLLYVILMKWLGNFILCFALKASCVQGDVGIRFDIFYVQGDVGSDKQRILYCLVKVC